jgi:hypothetical protein
VIFFPGKDLTPGIRDFDPATTLEHDYYTRRQKFFGAMEPNMKMLIEEIMKQVCDEIKQSRKEFIVNFMTHLEAIHKHVFELEAAV